MKVWITKYALTSGIEVVNGELFENDTAVNYGNCYAHGEGREWHKTEEAAIIRAEKMRSDKIASLRKSISKLEKLRFTPSGNVLP